MKPDLYTKALLTLITLFLGVLASDKVYDAIVTEAQASTADKWECSQTYGWHIAQNSAEKPDHWLATPEGIANKRGWTFMTTPILRTVVLDHEEWFVCGRP